MFPANSQGRRKLATLAASLVVVSLLSAACGADPTTDRYLAEYVPFANTGADTAQIFPGPDSGRYLIENWPDDNNADLGTLAVTEAQARVRFFAVRETTRSLVVEARPPSPPGAPSQTLAVTLNGTSIATLPMDRRWREYVIELPGAALRPGWNEIELQFAHLIRPMDFDAGSTDRRSLAALFRKLQIQPGPGQPPWSNPPGVSVSHPDDRAATQANASLPAADVPADYLPDFSAASIDMGAESMMEIFVVPTHDMELLGKLSATFDDAGAAGEIRAVIEIVDAATATSVWEGSFSASSSGGEDVRVELGRWANELVRLRVRVLGSVGSTVRWSELRTSSSRPGFDERLGVLEKVDAGRRARLFDKPDIFLVLLDAARADAFLGDRGAELAPNVQALAAQGTTFLQAWSPSAWTGQSVPALLTGLTPDSLGITGWETRLPPGATTFPEVLRDAGYRTVLFSQHRYYEPHTTIEDGFDVFEIIGGDPRLKRNSVPSAALLVDQDRPTFALIHLLPPHTPYRAPPPFAGSRSGWYEGDREPTLDVLRSVYGDRDFPEEERDEVRRLAIARYEENVLYADDLVGRVMQELQQAGRFEDALIIVLSDHGEAFGEHGRFLHTWHLYEEFIHVPLVVKWPRGWNEFRSAVEAPVSLIDVPPTLLEAIGIDDERARYQGRSLLPAVLSAEAPDRLLFAHTSGGQAPKYAVRWGDLKLVFNLLSDSSRLYDLSSDPLERVDLSARMPLQYRALTQAMNIARARNTQVLLSAGGAGSGVMDEEMIRSLRALGYLR